MNRKKLIYVSALFVGIGIGVFIANKATRLTPTANAGARTQSAHAAAPAFTLKNLEGKQTSLAEFKGRVVLVNFWATWCGPCRVEIPWLVAMQQKYEPQGFTVLGLAMDDEEEAVASPFVAKERFTVSGKQLPMNYPILIGTSDVADKFGGLLGFPTSVLVSKDGKIITHTTGIIREEEISKLVESELSANGGS